MSTPEQIRSKQCPLERHKGHQDLVVDVDDDGDGDDSSGVMPAIITFITSHAEESASLNCFHMLIRSQRPIGRTQSFISSAMVLESEREMAEGRESAQEPSGWTTISLTQDEEKWNAVLS